MGTATSSRAATGDGASGSPYRGADECSFCGLTRPSETLFAENARICSACVRLSQNVVVEQRAKSR